MQESIQNLTVNGVTRAVRDSDEVDLGFADRVADILLALSDQSEDLRAKIALEQAARKLCGLSEALKTINDRLELEYDRGYQDGRDYAEDWG